MYKKSIFWFRQDLRMYDNRWFIECIKASDKILPIFILDKNIIDWFWWLGDKKFGFIRESLEHLSKDIKKLSWNEIKIFFDTPENIIPFLVKKYHIESIYCNRSYSRYGTKRDETIQNMLNKKNIDFHTIADFLLVEPESVPQRKVYTPFYNIWKTKIIDTIEKIPFNFTPIYIEENYKISDFISLEKHPYFTIEFWKDRFKNHIHSEYDEYRNNLDIDWTSKLSPYIRFWIFSVRQLYNKAIISNEQFVKELAWREFWQHINYYFPETKYQEFQENKRHIQWDNNEFLFARFCEGKTGYPIVDAAIKQLIETNRMHGRARMIVASFLTKDLHIDWKLWEVFFKKHLLDYDENMNFWNWQWSASVWADPKPFRIFSPILQSQKFDTDAKFIKKYIPELENSDLKSIHNPLENILDYYPPIVDHRIEQKIARYIYSWKKEKSL